eukprot:2264400-Amphidinium_carterae.1
MPRAPDAGSGETSLKGLEARKTHLTDTPCGVLLCTGDTIVAALRGLARNEASASVEALGRARGLAT